MRVWSRAGATVAMAAAVLAGPAGSDAAAQQNSCAAPVLVSSSEHFGVAGGTGSFTFIAGAPGPAGLCTDWVIVAPDPWVTITAPAVLSGSTIGLVTVNYTVAPNAAVVMRTTVVTISLDDRETDPASATHTITQDGQPACPTISLSPATIPSGTAGLAYPPVAFSATGGAAPVTVALTSGTLPAGMSFSGGTLAGTPTQTGTFTFTLMASDANQCPGGRTYILVIGCASIDLGPDSLPDGMTGVAYPTVTFSAFGGVAPVTLTSSGALPDGMTFAVGQLSGTPNVAGTFSISVTATDVNGCTATRHYTFVVTGELVITQRGPGRGSAFGEVISPQTLPGLPAGTIVRLTAEPRYDSTFAGWSGHPDCQDGSVTVVGTMRCVANFVRLPLGPSVYLNDDCEADVFTYGLATGRWSREILNGPIFRSERVASSEPGWLIRSALLNGEDRFTDFIGYNMRTGVWFKATNDVQAGFDRFASTWGTGWQVFAVELNGDTAGDVFLYNPITGGWRAGINVGPGDFRYVEGRWGTNWEVYPVEFNGDRLTDLFLHDAATGQFLRAVNDGTGDFSCSTTGQSCEDTTLMPSRWEPDWEVYPGDFDGDGRSDLLLYNGVSGSARVVLTLASGLTTAVGPLTLGRGWTVQVGDLDGDGRDDLFLYNPITGAYALGVQTMGGAISLAYGVWLPGWLPFLRHAYPLIDYRADILMYEESTGRWFQVFNDEAGPRFGGGIWEPNLDIFAQIPSLPGRHRELPGNLPPQPTAGALSR